MQKVNSAIPMRRADTRRSRIFTLVLLVGVTATIPFPSFVRTGHLLWAVRSLASGASGSNLPIVERKIHARLGERDIEALVYAPARSAPDRALIITPGISELGCYHPSLMALSRFLADDGFLVVTPDVTAFREFRITAEPIDELLLWYRQIPTLPEARQLRRIGLGGVSFSGTLSLIAAARPEIRDSVGFVMGIGCYSDLHRLSREWFKPAPQAKAGDPYPTRFYAKWIMMLAARDMIPVQRERDFMRAVLIALLTQKQAPLASSDLSPEARRWYNLAVAPQDQWDPELARDIEQFLTPALLRQLDPRPVMSDVRCPVFLVHGDFDDLIPAEESRQLSQLIRTRPHLLISPFLSHTHPWDKPLSWMRKTEAGIETGMFLYDLARVLH